MSDRCGGGGGTVAPRAGVTVKGNCLGVGVTVCVCVGVPGMGGGSLCLCCAGHIYLGKGETRSILQFCVNNIS